MGAAEVFAELDRLIGVAGAGDLCALLGRLVEAEERARLRLRSEQTTGRRDDPPSPTLEATQGGKLLTAREAAGLAGVSPRWLRRHTKGLRFRRDLSRKLVQFEEVGFRRWLQAQRGA